MRYIYNRIFKFIGWKSKGEFSDLPKYVIIVAPHTSWTDFFIGLWIRSIHRLDAFFLGKAELFVFPFAGIFKALGGYPVERSKSHNLVDQVVKIFESKDRFRIALAPEGTRRKVNELKTGFYYIALKAQIPIVMVAFDYQNKEVRIRECFYPSGNIDEDMKIILNYFSGVKGRYAEKGID